MNGWPAAVARSGETVLFVLNIETDGAKTRKLMAKFLRFGECPFIEAWRVLETEPGQEVIAI